MHYLENASRHLTESSGFKLHTTIAKLMEPGQKSAPCSTIAPGKSLTTYLHARCVRSLPLPYQVKSGPRGSSKSLSHFVPGSTYGMSGGSSSAEASKLAKSSAPLTLGK